MSTEKPDDANEGCVGPQSESAGKASTCDGCPNQAVCASGAPKVPDPSIGKISARLQDVEHTILVLSGKGGVGKSTIACQLAFALASEGKQVGLLDVDICGPSVPQMLGLIGHEVHKSAAGWSPVYVDDNLGVMSIGFMLPGADDAVIWRGPRKNGLIKQFLSDVDWGTLDYLVVDTPPGTSDEHISTVQYLKDCNVDGAVIVTTPQEVSLADVRKEINFCKKTGIKVLGVVGNMGTLKIPVSKLCFSDGDGKDCTESVMAALTFKLPGLQNMTISTDVFNSVQGNSVTNMATKMGVPVLGHVPLDPNLLKVCEEGSSFLQAYPESAAAKPFAAIVQALKKSIGDVK